MRFKNMVTVHGYAPLEEKNLYQIFERRVLEDHVLRLKPPIL